MSIKWILAASFGTL